MNLRVLLPFLMVSVGLQAAVIQFNSDPFAGSTALTTAGRQVVGGEPFITFSIANDIFLFHPGFFAVNQLSFANNIAGSLPISGINTIVLRSFDDDSNTATAFGAGNAANLIATQITAPGAGFFIYFNSGLDLARLVYSTDLNDNTADLKILARMTNLSGQAGRDAFSTITSSNFVLAPEPGSWLLAGIGVGLLLAGRFMARRSS